MIKRIFIVTIVGLCAVLQSQAQDFEDIQKRICQREKAAFFATDLAGAIVNDLRWSQITADSAQVKKVFQYPIPSVLKRTENGKMSIHLPCLEDDTDEYFSACVLTKHNRLDSALILAKIKGVDEIYQRFSGSYADYMRKAILSCVCIKQEGNLFYVNAAIRVPKTKYVVDKRALKKNMRKLKKEAKRKKI